MSAVDQAGLDALPNGAVIKTDHGIYMRNKPRLFPDQWCWLKQGTVDEYPRIYLRRPAEVLYNPDAPEEPATVEEIAYEALQATNEGVRAATNRVAAAIVEQMEPELDWDNMPSEEHRELYREVARAAIQALASE